MSMKVTRTYRIEGTSLKFSDLRTLIQEVGDQPDNKVNVRVGGYRSINPREYDPAYIEIAVEESDAVSGM